MEIQPWTTVAPGWFREAIHDFLAANIARGGDLLPTPKNVAALLVLGMMGAAAGDPCFVALHNGQPAGFVLWAGVREGLESRWKTCHAHGSYTTPAMRGMGVARALRRAAWDCARDRGYERVIGPVHTSNPKGVREFVAEFGAWPVSYQMEALV